MTQDHNSIRSIMERLAQLEGRTTPVTTKSGLNAQQKSVHQMPALFRPPTKKILGGDADAKDPVAGYMFGDSVNNNKEMAEDVLDTVQDTVRSFSDYLEKVQNELRDTDLKSKKKSDSDIKPKPKKAAEPGLKSKQTEQAEGEIDAALSGIVPAAQPAGEPGVSIRESHPVKTIANECGLWEIHGNEPTGFEIRREGRCMPSRFDTLDQAQVALEMFVRRRQMTDMSQDYVDEA